MIGELNHRIKLEQLLVEKDNLEQEIETWQLAYEVWADIKPLSGKEYFKARQTKSDIMVQVTIRYRPQIHNHMRMLFNNQIYEIVSVINVNQENRYLQLLCKEGVELV